MTMDLALIAIIKIIFVNVDLKIVLALLLERALDGEYLIFPKKDTKFVAPSNRTPLQTLFLTKFFTSSVLFFNT